MELIYLDYNATTPTDPSVVESMLPYITNQFGNAASTTHDFGKQAKKAVSKSRRTIAGLINAKPSEIIFTSGATEAINIAITGLVLGRQKSKNKIITTTVEHKAVLDTCKFAENFGVITEYLEPDQSGIVKQLNLEKLIDNNTLLVAVQQVNNEIGTIQPIREIGRICLEKNIPLFVDAAQSIGKVSINVKEMGVSLLAGSSHKIYGPKGVGFLYLDSIVKKQLKPIIHGGGHEKGLRPGTLNVPSIVGFGKAIDLVIENMDKEVKIIDNLNKSFLSSLDDWKIDYKINGSMSNRVAGNLNICFNGVDADWLILHTPDVAISTGSACTSETIEPSHVLKAIGLPNEDSNSSIRISFGRFTTQKQINKAATLIAKSVKTFLDKKKMVGI